MSENTLELRLAQQQKRGRVFATRLADHSRPLPALGFRFVFVFRVWGL